MASFSDELFGDYGAALLNDYHADGTQVVYSPPSGPSVQTWVIIRDTKTKELVKLSGVIEHITEVQLLVHRDPNSDWKGIADPDLNGTWQFGGFTWQQAKQDTEAVDAQTTTFTACTVRRIDLTAVGHPGRIREAIN